MLLETYVDTPTPFGRARVWPRERRAQARAAHFLNGAFVCGRAQGARRARAPRPHLISAPPQAAGRAPY